MLSDNIVKSVDEKILDKGILSVSERYYEHKYCIKINEINNIHQRVSFHTNRICLLSLANNHPALRNDIKFINWKINDHINREENCVSGKGKRHAQKVHPDSIICFIQTVDGGNYPVYSCIQGKLIEINHELKSNPSLVKRKPIAEGYIALILPFLQTYDALKNSMLSSEEYIQLQSSHHVS